MKIIFKLSKKFLLLFLIIMLPITNFAAISVSDGSAFVSKSEFSSTINNISNRMSIIENTLDAKIDSLVSSYLSRNGIWNGAAQTISTDTRGGWLVDLPSINDCSIDLETFKTYVFKISPIRPYNSTLTDKWTDAVNDNNVTFSAFNVTFPNPVPTADSPGYIFSPPPSEQRTYGLLVENITKSGMLVMNLGYRFTFNGANRWGDTGTTSPYYQDWYNQWQKNFTTGTKYGISNDLYNCYPTNNNINNKNIYSWTTIKGFAAGYRTGGFIINVGIVRLNNGNYEQLAVSEAKNFEYPGPGSTALFNNKSRYARYANLSDEPHRTSYSVFVNKGDKIYLFVGAMGYGRENNKTLGTVGLNSRGWLKLLLVPDTISVY